MLALRKSQAAHGLQLTHVNPPAAPGPGEVLLRVRAVGVCGTDLHIAEWTPSYHFMVPHLPVTVGHEFSGEVLACGPQVHGLAVGRLVTVRPSVVCGRCGACLAGEPDGCTTRRGIGVTRDGAFTEQVVVPARNCVPVPPGLPPAVAALAEPLSVSWEAVRTGGVGPGDRVLVLGPGNIGQGIALLARDAGARQVVVAGYQDRLRLAVLSRMGFTDLLDLADGPFENLLAPYLTEGPFDVVIEATGAGAVIGPALAALKVRGVLVVAGIHAQPVPIDLTALVRRHQQLRGSYRAPEAAWPEVVAALVRHQGVLQHMVTHTLPLAQALDGIALARDKQATKVVVLP